jgi:hypothetical protein
MNPFWSVSQGREFHAVRLLRRLSLGGDIMTRWLFLALWVGMLGGSYYQRAKAQEVEARGLSFSVVTPDPSGDGTYTVPIAHGGFADLEMVSTSDSTGLVRIAVFDEEGLLRTRASGVLANRRVLLASELLGVENLFELSPVVTIEIESEVSMNVVEVRRD